MPPLTMLADKLRLPPSIAGITLLALGNGQHACPLYSVCKVIVFEYCIQSHTSGTWLV